MGLNCLVNNITKNIKLEKKKERFDLSIKNKQALNNILMATFCCKFKFVKQKNDSQVVNDQEK